MSISKKVIQTALCTLLIGSTVYAQSLSDAKAALDAEQYQKTKSILKGLTTSQPGEAENYFYLGNAYLRTDYPDSAKIAFNKGVAADAKFPLNYVGLGAMDLWNGNASAAQANFNKAIDLTKKKDQSTYREIGRAYIYTKKPDYVQGLANLEKAKEINDKDAAIYLAMGDAYVGQQKNSEAFSAYRSAFDYDASLLRAKIQLGVITKEAKAFKEAEDQFKAVLATNPNYAPAYRELAETYYRWGTVATSEAEYADKNKQALQFYEKYMDLTDRSLDSRLRHADFLILTKDFKTLESEAQAMSKMDKSNLRVYRYLGYAAYENGNYAASAQALKDFIAKVEPSRIIPLDYAYLGKAQLRDSLTFQAGLANLNKAISQDSTTAAGLNDIAKQFYNDKKYPQAAEVYKLSFLDPKSTTDLNDHLYLGLVYYFDYALKAQANKNADPSLLAKADTAMSYVLQKSPDATAALLYRARIRRLADDQENPKGLMLPDYEKYIEVVSAKPTPTDSEKRSLIEAYNNIGAYYAKSNQLEKAKQYLNKTVALDPSDAYASSVLKQIGGGGK